MGSSIAGRRYACADCACRVEHTTLHMPPCGLKPEVNNSNTSALPPCFIPAPVPLSTALGDYLEPCLLDGCLGAKAGVQGTAAQCLTPDRGPLGARRALFLLGDSHSVALMRGLR